MLTLTSEGKTMKEKHTRRLSSLLRSVLGVMIACLILGKSETHRRRLPRCGNPPPCDKIISYLFLCDACGLGLKAFGNQVHNEGNVFGCHKLDVFFIRQTIVEHI